MLPPLVGVFWDKRRFKMTDEQYIQVQNLTGGTVVYTIPEDNIRRVFAAYEVKKITPGELRKVFYQPGGEVLLQNFLSIKNKELALEFGVSQDSFEHEYTWTVNDVEKLLLEGSMDALHDALDFAPEGIIDLIVDKAIELRIPDINKRNLIQESTGKNITGMINTQIALEEALGADEKDNKPKQRRVNTQKQTESVSTGRRVQ